MSITLLAPARVPLMEIGRCLNPHVEVLLASLDGTFKSGLAGGSQLVFLILDDQDFITSADLANRVRGTLVSGQRLILCMPFPVDRAALLDMGADEVITPAAKAVTKIAERILAHLILQRQILPYNYGPLYGATSPMHALFRQIETLAPLNEPLLICGETGTGKELIAQEIHRRSGRPGNCLAVNCAELNPELLGSELFGHEKGAFTNAVQARKGLLAEAGEGSILLDEIGDLDLQSQAKLLRVLEERKVRRLGANRWENITARILFATNRNLEEDTFVGRFRHDLYERIRGFILQSPPLRDRKADIPLLVEHLVQSYGEEYRRKLVVPAEAFDSLFRYEWPGNVRELRFAARRAATYADGEGSISILMLQDAARGRTVIKSRNSIEFDPDTDSWRDVQRIAQAAYFRAILTEADGNKEIAIKRSGLSKSQFYEKLKEME